MSRNEISTFAKLRISSHDLHIEKGRHRKIILSERKCFLCKKFVEDQKHFVTECFSLSAHRNTFFDELAQIFPSFFSKTEDEKFSFIMECKDYDIARVCITHTCKMFRARDNMINSNNINASCRTNADNA